MDHDGVLYLGKIRSERWFGATLCAPGGAGTGHDWALSARRKRQTIVGGWLRGTLTFRRTRTVTAGVSGGSGYSRGVSSRPHQRLPLLQCSRDFRDPPGRYWEHVGKAGGDQIDLEFALKPPLSSSKAKTQETINSLFKCPNRRNNSPRWCLSDHWTPENVAELVIWSVVYCICITNPLKPV